MKVKTFIVIFALILLSACASQNTGNPNQVQQMKADLEAAKNTIAQLRISETELKKELSEKNRVIGVLGNEKTSRVQESSSLRGQVRRFVQMQIDDYKNFMVQGGLLDYLGGELVERANVEQKPLQIVDLANSIPRAGTLTGVGAHFVKPGYFSVKVLRKVENNLVVIWDSKPLLITQEGINRVNFPVSVGVEKGDVIGYYFGEGVAVSFDEGTGDTRFQTSELGLGAAISPNNLQGEKRRRAYSVGVYGLLN